MPDWASVAVEHRSACKAKQDAEARELEPLWAAISDVVKAQILALDASALLDAMRRGDMTSEQVTLVYAERAYHIGCKQVNAVTESFFLEALQAARASDARRKESPSRPARPLEGLPMSIKDCFYMRGSFSSVGITARTLNPGKSADDGLMVKILRDAGAIPLFKTNNPAGLMWNETINLLHGKTVNPFDFTRSPGGSSGGEGAAVAAQCSPLGVGTDIGGSIRTPSLNCGVYGFKCTERRLSTKGLALQEGPGQESILSMPGPMGRSTDDCALIMKTWLCDAMFRGDEAYTPPVPFDEDKYRAKTPLRVAVVNKMNKAGLMSKASARAVHEAAQAFKAAGAVVIDGDPRLGMFDRGNLLFVVLQNADEAKWLFDVSEGEEILTAAKPPAIPSMFEKFESKEGIGGRSLVNQLQYRQRLLREEVTAYFDEHAIDVLLCPGNELPAGQSLSPFVQSSNTSWVNCIGFPAGAVPITTVRPGETSIQNSELATTARRKKAVQAMEASMLGSEGMPIGVHLVGRKWQDETVLRAMKTLESYFPITFPESTLSGPPSLRAALSKSNL